jgi:hypothetical protein
LPSADAQNLPDRLFDHGLTSFETLCTLSTNEAIELFGLGGMTEAAATTSAAHLRFVENDLSPALL